jgi:hypothetical protein
MHCAASPTQLDAAARGGDIDGVVIALPLVLRSNAYVPAAKGNAEGAKMSTKIKAWVAFGLFAATLQAISWKFPDPANGWLSWIGIIASVPFALWLTHTVLEDDNKHR